MSSYYTTNALYEYLEENKTPGFVYAKENIWLLIYGTGMADPRLILVVSAVPRKEIENVTFLAHELEIIKTAQQLSERSGLNVYVMRYPESDNIMEKIQVIDPSKNEHRDISIDLLPGLLESNGLIVSRSASKKYLNDRTSSPFHQWQRANMGPEIIATDIDLIRLKGVEPYRIYELKRSYIPLTEWSPCPDDFPNYKLIANFAGMAGLDFRIAYNRRTKNPVFDDISRLKRFSFSAAEESARYLDTISLEEFLED